MDISSLVELIKSDMERDGSYDRYPVRFFSMKYEEGTADALIQLQIQLSGVEFFDIKDLLPHEDAWFTTDYLTKAIHSLSSMTSYIVVGFSEYARFLTQEEFISLLISFLELENPADAPKRRIYIPCFALYNQIKQTINTFHRRKDAYNPLLNETDIEDLPRMYFVDDRLDVDYHSNEVFSSAEWFGMWRNPDIDTRKPIICSSRTLSHFYTVASPDNVYNIQYLTTYQDVLRHIYLIDNIHSYQQDTAEFYSRIITLVKNAQNKELADIVLSEVNAQYIDASNIYILWKNNNIFKRWLLQNYVFLKSPKDSYLYKVMSTMEDLSEKEFLEKMYQCIFELNNVSLCDERKLILSTIKQVEKDISFSKSMIAYYNGIITGIVRRKTTIIIETIDFTKDDESLIEKKDVLAEAVGEEVAPYLTCFSDYERQLTIWLYRMGIINNIQVENIYPNLWNYINGAENDSDPQSFAKKFAEYFKSYRSVRLAQTERSAYDTVLRTWNKDENTFFNWYFNRQIEYPEVYLKKKNFSGRTYVLDGVSAEFLEYLLKLLEEKGYSVEASCYGKCHLPSTSSVAQEFYPADYEWILDYDQQVVHGDIYYHALNLERALFVIETLIDRIISVEGEDTFAITADHGSTVGHKLQKKVKKYSFEDAEHDGRCYHNKDKKHIDPTIDYAVYDDEAGRQWVVALNQQSLCNNSKYATHGGATLEEVLVPVIIAHKGKQDTKFYRVSVINLKVSGLHKKVEVKISPMPKDDKVRLKAKDGTDTEMAYYNDTKTWIGEVKKGIEQDIEIIVNKQIFKFKTIPPTKMGDDLFDD